MVIIMKLKALYTIGAMVTSMFLLAGCSSTDTTSSSVSTEITESSTSTDTIEATESNSDESETTSTEVVEETASEVSYPITIEHYFGETVIESKPERVATIAWGNQDVPLALGVTPVGMAAANWGPLDENNLLPWTAQALSELGGEMPLIYDETDGIDFEAVASAEPDVILAGASGLTQEDYDILSEIAPVIAYTTAPWQTLWREQILLDAKGMGMEQEGIDLVAELEALIAEKIAQYPEFEGKTAMFTWIDVTNLSSFYVYLPTDPRAAYLTDLGFEFPQSVLDLATETDAFSISVSSEIAPTLTDVDILVAYGDPASLATLQADPLLSKIPAIANGSVVFLENGSNVSGASTQTALSIPYVIDEYLELFGEAVNKINEE